MYLVRLQTHLTITLTTPVGIPSIPLNGVCSTEYTNDIFEAAKDGRVTVLITLGLSVAFDTSEHLVHLFRLDKRT